MRYGGLRVVLENAKLQIPSTKETSITKVKHDGSRFS